VTEIIKIQWIGVDGMDYKEVSLAEAKRLVAEACEESFSVIDKKTGFTVGEITPTSMKSLSWASWKVVRVSDET